METFNFSPDSQVPVTLPPTPMQGLSMNGWSFAVRPAVPYQKKFKVTLYGMHWYLDPLTDLFDLTMKPTLNARLLELFYERNGVWNPFNWHHPHLGDLVVKFDSAVTIPEAQSNSGGLIDKFDVTMVHYNPRYSNGQS